MTIFFDHQTFSIQSFGGISRLNAELISGINRSNNNAAYLSVLLSTNIHLQDLGLLSMNFFPNKNFYKKSQIIYRVNQIYTILQLNRRHFDVFHSTYYDPYFIPYLKKRPFVITIHDMIHEKFSNQFHELNNRNQSIEQKELLANRADQIIAVSENTKRDIVTILNIDPAKIQVIHPGSSFKPTDGKITAPLIEAPYLLFVGRRERYKNFEGLLLAIHPLLKKYKIKLVCAGGDAFTPGERQLIHSVGADVLVEQRPITDQILPVLYQQAVAFIFPTMYEGFGIPVLEAFACDCPCIVSNLSSLPEVGGDAALYIDPASSDSIVQAVERVIHDAQLRQELIEKGRKQLTKFSWERTVEETLKVYKNLL